MLPVFNKWETVRCRFASASIYLSPYPNFLHILLFTAALTRYLSVGKQEDLSIDWFTSFVKPFCFSRTFVILRTHWMFLCTFMTQRFLPKQKVGKTWIWIRQKRMGGNWWQWRLKTIYKVTCYCLLWFATVLLYHGTRASWIKSARRGGVLLFVILEMDRHIVQWTSLLSHNFDTNLYLDVCSWLCPR